VLQEFTEQHPNCPRGWYHHARWLFWTGDSQTAADAIMKAYALYQNDADIYGAACEILPAAGKLTELQPLLEEMLRRFPERWSVWATAGLVLVEWFKDGERACVVASQGPQLQPHLTDAWFQHGRVLALAGRHREAITALEEGLVNNNQNILSVVLDMNKGAFAAKDIQIDMSDQQKIAFSDAVKAYFVLHPVTFIINSLDLTGITTLADLKPHQFRLKALQTQNNKNEMLQLFIQTNNRAIINCTQTYISTSIKEPIPEGSECSLMINSRIFFGSVLPASLTRWKLTGKNPGNTTSAWSAQMTSASVQGNVDLSSLDYSYTPPPGGGSPGSTTYYTYEPTGGNPVTWSIDGMTINPAKNGQMTMNYSEKKTFNFTETATKYYILFFPPQQIGTSHHSTDITLNIYSSLPTEIIGSGRNQEVQINIANKDVSFSARTSGGGPCGSDDLQAQVNKLLQALIPGQITNKLNVNFNSVSVFALENLLFPSNNYINLQSVYVPGDLLILGNFTVDGGRVPQDYRQA